MWENNPVTLIKFSWSQSCLRENVKRSFHPINKFSSSVIESIYYYARFSIARRVKRKCSLTALSAFPTFWHAIGIQAACTYMAAGSGSPYCLNVMECQGIYVAYVYGFIVYRSRDRRDVRSGFAYDVAPADPVGTLAFMHMHVRMWAQAFLCPLVYVHERHMPVYMGEIRIDIITVLAICSSGRVYGVSSWEL